MGTLGVPTGMWFVLGLAAAAVLVLVAVVVTGYLRINQPRLTRVRECPQHSVHVITTAQEPARADAA